MKQLEFKNHEEILSILMFYQDVGVDLSILQNEQMQKNKSLEQDKKGAPDLSFHSFSIFSLGFDRFL